ncbi:MAG: CDP-glycerol glycerophosphotransferase family protein [Candidatus Thorarchaeota archaeon]
MSAARKNLQHLKKRIFGNRAIVGELIHEVVRILDYLYPKDKRTIVFGSYGTKSISGDPRWMFERMQKEHPEFSVYYFTNKPTKKGHIPPSSLRSLLIFLRAKYGVTSTSITDFGQFRWSSRKKMIATWHAISLKSCGYAMKHRTYLQTKKQEEYTKSIKAAIASSKHDAGISCLMFGYGGRIHLTGHPRNDHLVNYDDDDKKKIREIFPRFTGEERFILYAPTFRDQVMLDKGMNLKLFPFADFDNKRLNQFLRDNNMVILLRTHINDTTTNLEVDNDRVIHFGQDVCPDINTVLGDMDYVVTDYSSIGYDFLLVNKPMIFIPYDLEEYEKHRGLIIDDYDFWTPGPKVSSLKEFLKYIELCNSGSPDPYEEKRVEMRRVMHSHQTDDSTSRVLNLLKRL